MNYTIKTFSKSWVYKKTINPDIIQNDISFSSSIDWGLWEIVLLLKLEITNTDFTQGDQIKVWKEKTLIYGGFIDSVGLRATNNEEIELRATWYFSLFSRNYYEEGGDYTITKTDDPSEIIKDIVSFFNTKYDVLTSDTETVGTTATIETEYTDLLSMIKNLKWLSENYFWYVDESWNFKFKEKANDAQNKLTFAKDIFSLDSTEDSTKIVNRLFLERKDGTVSIYNDTASQNAYGVREKYIKITTIDDLSSANIYGNEYISENKDPLRTMKLIIGSWYKYTSWAEFDDLWDQTFNDLDNQAFQDLTFIKDIENIQPGETVKIRNITKDFWTLLITKKVYTPHRISLTLDNYENFISLIKE